MLTARPTKSFTFVGNNGLLSCPSCATTDGERALVRQLSLVVVSRGHTEQTNTPIIKSYIELRYTPDPYIKSFFAQFSKTGRMIMRPLFVDFSTADPNIVTWTNYNTNFTTQQYMFGPRLLVTPITLSGVTTWQVYLPNTGALGNLTKPWTYWWTNQNYADGQNVTISAPLAQIPLFYLGSRAEILSGNVF